MKRNYAFVEFSDPRDADDARHSLNGRDLDGSRITVEFSRGAPRGPGGSLVLRAKGPVPGSGRCFNCGIDGHWSRECKAGDWKNKCYRCGERGHILRTCQNSPRKRKRGRSYSRSPSPRRGRSRSRSLSRIYSRSRSSPKRARVLEHSHRSRSPVRSKSARRLSRRGKHSPKPDERRSPGGKASLSPRDVGRHTYGSDYGRSRSPVGRSKSPAEEVGRKSPMKREDNSSMEANGGGDHSPSPIPGKESSEK